MVGRDFVRGAEMDFRQSPERGRILFLDDLARRLFHRSRDAASESQAKALAGALEPVDECGARQN